MADTRITRGPSGLATPDEVIETWLSVIGRSDVTSLPEQVRATVARYIEYGSPQAAFSELERYLKTLDRPTIRQARARSFQKARRRHGVTPGQMRPERPAWQRQGGVLGLRTRLMPAMQDVRVRGQLVL